MKMRLVVSLIVLAAGIVAVSHGLSGHAAGEFDYYLSRTPPLNVVGVWEKDCYGNTLQKWGNTSTSYWTFIKTSPCSGGCVAGGAIEAFWDQDQLLIAGCLAGAFCQTPMPDGFRCGPWPAPTPTH
jgi:hypothetical protein